MKEPPAVHSANCLALRPVPIDAPQMTGERFGEVVVIGLYRDISGSKRSAGAAWVVQCECGLYTHRTLRTLRRMPEWERCDVCKQTERLKAKQAARNRAPRDYRGKAAVSCYRDEAVVSQHNLCWWCETNMQHPGARTPAGKPHPKRATAEHIIPRWMGGPNEAWNIKAACDDCNKRRGNSFSPPPTTVNPHLKMRSDPRIVRFVARKQEEKQGGPMADYRLEDVHTPAAERFVNPNERKAAFDAPGTDQRANAG